MRHKATRGRTTSAKLTSDRHSASIAARPNAAHSADPANNANALNTVLQGRPRPETWGPVSRVPNRRGSRKLRGVDQRRRHFGQAPRKNDGRVQLAPTALGPLWLPREPATKAPEPPSPTPDEKAPEIRAASEWKRKFKQPPQPYSNSTP